jgi:drug/metabolite transporter (DMT)-like permease
VSRETLGLLVGFIGVAIFAGTLPFTRVAVEALDPWFVTAGRASLSGVLAGAVLIALRRRVPDARTLKTIAWASFFIVGGFPALTALAMTRVEASHGGVVLGILPLATAGISAFITGERPSARFWAAAVAGAALVAGFALRDGGGRFEAGDLMLAFAVASAAVGYNLSGRLAESMSGWEVISWILVVALPVTVPLTLWLAPTDPAAVPTRCWTAFAYVTLMSQYVGFFAWNAGLALGGVTRVSQVQLLQTFVTLVIAAALNGERVDALTWAVAVLVVALVVVGRRSRIVTRGRQPSG